jgi:hypothetical protein
LLNKSSFDRNQDQISTFLTFWWYHVAKQKFKITSWNAYYKMLVNRGSLTFWLDESAIQAWYEEPKPLRVVARNVILIWLLPRTTAQTRLSLHAAYCAGVH